MFGYETLHVCDYTNCGTHYFDVKEIGNSFACSTKRDYLKCVEEYVNNYRFATSELALMALKVVEKRDNELATYLNLHTYKVMGVRQLVEGRFGVDIMLDNGKVIKFIETHLGWYALRNGENMLKYILNKRNYFTAGGLEDKDVDFIFNGVGHSSIKDLYRFTDGEIIR